MGCLLSQKHLDIQIAHVALLVDISTLFSKNQLSALSCNQYRILEGYEICSWKKREYQIILGSYLIPRFIVSDVPIIEMPNSMLLQILAALKGIN